MTAVAVSIDVNYYESKSKYMYEKTDWRSRRKINVIRNKITNRPRIISVIVLNNWNLNESVSFPFYRGYFCEYRRLPPRPARIRARVCLVLTN